VAAVIGRPRQQRLTATSARLVFVGFVIKQPTELVEADRITSSQTCPYTVMVISIVLCAAAFQGGAVPTRIRDGDRADHPGSPPGVKTPHAHRTSTHPTGSFTGEETAGE
jgi:hypothetical protein